MSDDEIARRKFLTFEQAEGLAELPRQLARQEISPQLRAVLWNYIHESVQESSSYTGYNYTIDSPWAELLKRVHVYRDHRPIDEFDGTLSIALQNLKPVFTSGDYAKIYGWLQFVMRAFNNKKFSQRIATILEFCRAPYRVLEDSVLVPIASEQEAKAVEIAIVETRKAGLAGATEHLKSAASALTEGQYADSVRESIHAVESVARMLEPSAELSKALAKLETSAKIHGALKKGFLALYGYASDERGIRHPLLDDASAKVDEADALFMIAACSAFVSYIINRGRVAGLLK